MLDAQKNKGAPHPYLRNPNVRWFDVDLSDLRTMPFEDRELDRYGLKAGDVVICEGGEAGRAAIWPADAPEVRFQKAIHRVRTGPDLFNRFLVHRLKADHDSGVLADYYTGATIKHLTGQDLARYRFALPPLVEQRRIAEVLDRAETLRAQRRQALAQLDALAEAIFLDMFGSPAANSKQWPVVTVGQLCRVLGGKRLPKGAEYSSVATPFRYVRVTDLRGGFVEESALLYLKPEVQSAIARYIVETGDIIVSIAGSIGLIAEVTASVAGANLTENAAKLVALGDSRYVPAYLAAALRSAQVQEQMAGLTGQVTIGKLALFRIEQVAVPLPPRSLQLAYAARMAALQALRASQHEALAHLNTLFTSLQHRAFRGEL